jgi:carbon-monoxide dehydrogenase medium subunit
MKPAPFMYMAPRSLEEACSLLAEHGDDAKVLAGGQSLGPLMNLRLSTPGVLVDINRIPDLDGIISVGGSVRIGALARQRSAERSSVVGMDAPLVVEALQSVGHLGIRNRGTVAGSIAHADPAAEMPAVLTALRGSVRAVGPGGGRVIPASELFESYFTTTLDPDEIVVEVLVPARSPGTGQAWLEFAQRHGDYAMVGVGASLSFDDAGVCRDAALVCTGIDSVPYDASAAAATLVGGVVTEEDRSELAQRVSSECSPSSDIVADAKFRRRLVRVLVARTLAAARLRAGKGAHGGG